jgi:hypothetical protein
MWMAGVTQLTQLSKGEAQTNLFKDPVRTAHLGYKNQSGYDIIGTSLFVLR